MTNNPLDMETWRRLKRRFFTSAGNFVALPVTETHTTVAVVFTRTEPDAIYGVCCTPNWLTTIAVTARTTTGCTLSFGTAAPASAVVDVLSFRTE